MGRSPASWRKETEKIYYNVNNVISDEEPVTQFNKQLTMGSNCNLNGIDKAAMN